MVVGFHVFVASYASYILDDDDVAFLIYVVVVGVSFMLDNPCIYFHVISLSHFVNDSPSLFFFLEVVLPYCSSYHT